MKEARKELGTPEEKDLAVKDRKVEEMMVSSVIVSLEIIVQTAFCT